MSESVIVQNKLILITGMPWSGKSFIAALLASIYREIDSNLKISYYWQQVSNDLYDIKQIWKIRFWEIKWCIVLDEAWVNMNSRKFMTDENQLYWELAMLWRKLNKDIIVIAQMDHTVDKNVRLLCKYHFEMNSWQIWQDYLMFEYNLYNRHWNLLCQKQIDLFEWARLSGFSYSSLEDSKIWKIKYWDEDDTEDVIEKEISDSYKERSRKF